MKAVLTKLTLISAVAVVLVLASYLIRIALILRRADQNLTDAAAHLERTRDNTAPLGSDLTTINDAAVALRDGLLEVDRNLLTIIRALRAAVPA